MYIEMGIISKYEPNCPKSIGTFTNTHTHINYMIDRFEKQILSSNANFRIQ